MSEPAPSRPERRSRLGLAAITTVLVVVVAWLVIAVVQRLWSTVVPAVVILVGCVLALRTQPTTLSFEVGAAERHHVAIRFDQFWERWRSPLTENLLRMTYVCSRSD